MFFVIDTKERRTEAAAFVAALTASPLMSVEIKAYKRDRSKAQNRLYWMWLNVIAQYLGYESEELHDVCKVRFLGIVSKDVDGKHLTLPVSTTSLDTAQFTAYLEKVEALGRSMSIVLPIPDDYGYAMNHKESTACGNH